MRAGDLEIAVTDWGGDGPPLLFVHATGFCAGVWRKVAENSTHRAHCYGYDQRGHGDSAKPAEQDAYAWERFADDCLAVLDALGIERCDAVGHSSGAATLVLAATREPGRFGRLVLIEPIIPPPLPVEVTLDEGGNLLAEGARRRRMSFDSYEDMWERFTSKPPMSLWDHDVLADYITFGSNALPDGSRTLKCPGEIEAAMYEGGSCHRGYDALPDLASPTLLLCGEERSPMPVEYWRHLAERVPEHRFATLPGCGHFAPMEKPGLISDEVAAFLADE